MAGPSSSADAIGRPFLLSNAPVLVRASAGVAFEPAGSDASAQELLRHADIAMRHAHRTGRAVEHYAPELETSTPALLTLATELHSAIRNDELRPLAEMIADEDFRANERVGLNYAQARYLMFYIQEKGLLSDYYAKFRDAAKEDPNGLKTLEALVAPQSLEAFEKDWRAWVLTLRFLR